MHGVDKINLTAHVDSIKKIHNLFLDSVTTIKSKVGEVPMMFCKFFK